VTIQCEQDGDTPLSTASYYGHAEVVRLLLAAPSVDVNANNKVIVETLQMGIICVHTCVGMPEHQRQGIPSNWCHACLVDVASTS
jgi:ankyrin repeat protein